MLSELTCRYFFVTYETGDSDDDDNGQNEKKTKLEPDKKMDTSCKVCIQKTTEARKLEKKFIKLKNKYLNLCVNFAETQMLYNDLLKANSDSVSAP